MPSFRSFEEMIALTRESIAAFEKVERRPWTVETSLIELSKQVGDLAKRVLTFERYYLPDRDHHPAYATTIDNIGNELADILYSLIRIALYYDIDLEKAHVKARHDELGYAAQAAVLYGSSSGPLGGRKSLSYAPTNRQAEDVKQHYQRLLAENYLWMTGGREQGMSKASRLFQRLLVGKAEGPASVLDLGCGPGFHALTLSHLGYRVLGIDQNATLLDEMVRFSAEISVVPLKGDIRDAGLYTSQAPFTLVLCLGDTLLHLSSIDDVSHLLADAASVLAPGGRLVVSMRDYSVELQGADRFLPVRSDGDKIMTVCLDYTRDHIHVTDMIYRRTGEDWVLDKSSYCKLRLREEQVLALLKAAGLLPEPPFLLDGLIHFVATGP